MGYYSAKHIVCGGNGIVFLRNAIKAPIWQCRLRVKGIKGYIYRSCDTQDMDEAMHFTRELYDDLRLRVKSGLPTVKQTFNNFFSDEWLPYAKGTLSIHRYRLHKYIGERYLVEFFGEAFLEDILEPMLGEYWDWRRDYWKVGPGADRQKANIAIHPSKKTLQIEKGILSQVFKHAKRRGYLSSMPLIEVSKNAHDTPAKRRPHFTRADWKQLYLYMNEWQHGGVHSLHRFQRQMLRNFVCFLMNSGMRPKEALSLRWQDLGKTEKGRIKIDVSEQTKTGARTTIPNDPTVRYLVYVWNITENKKPTDFIFADRSGKPMDQSHKTFETILRDTGLLKDGYGRNRTFYSCRHSHITFRLLEGVPIEDIARNCGTAVRQVEFYYDHIANEMKEDTLTQQISPHFENEWSTSANLFPKLAAAFSDPAEMENLEQDSIAMHELLERN